MTREFTHDDRSAFQPITLVPVGVVRGGRIEPDDDSWGSVEASIELDRERFGPDSVRGLEDFSHIDVVFVFHLREAFSEVTGSRRPRGVADLPEVGIFAQRASGRPNRIGVSTCELLGVEGTSVSVRGLDAVDGTPVLDIKPHLRSMGPRGQVREASWVGRIMENYWDPPVP
ncbi:MAG: SAM-dependent methyltransferase [Acidimicrobiales bacterium]